MPAAREREQRRDRVRACQNMAFTLCDSERQAHGGSAYTSTGSREARAGAGHVGAGARIHPDAVVHPSARIGEGVEIGAHSVVAAGAVIGANSRLHARALVGPNVSLGSGCVVHPGALLTGVVAGDDNHIHECVTLDGETKDAGGPTIRIGNNNRVMAYCHVGPHCRIGSGVTIANTVWLPHHVEVADQVMIGGLCLISPCVRIGRLAMVGFLSDVAASVPPFTMAEGIPCEVLGLNVVGLRRVGMTAAARTDLKRCYKLLYRSGLSALEATARIAADVDASPERDELLRFVRLPQNGGAAV